MRAAIVSDTGTQRAMKRVLVSKSRASWLGKLKPPKSIAPPPTKVKAGVKPPPKIRKAGAKPAPPKLPKPQPPKLPNLVPKLPGGWTAVPQPKSVLPKPVRPEIPKPFTRAAVEKFAKAIKSRIEDKELERRVLQLRLQNVERDLLQLQNKRKVFNKYLKNTVFGAPKA